MTAGEVVHSRQISNYRGLEKIAEGAQGVVYRAVHQRMDRPVALKFLSREALRNPADRQRFDREARLAGSLDHPGICQIFDYDEIDGQVFLAMPLLQGADLRTLLLDGPLPLETAVLIAIQVAEGLQQAHRHGVIHRDIKPSNLMITGLESGQLQAKILDFGLARGTDVTCVTKSGSPLGTAAYMSPEQVQGKELDARTDIWSLGAVLYEMVTGLRAFPGEYSQAVMYGILHDRPVPVGALRAGTRPELRRVIGRALAREPSERYAEAGEMLGDLRDLWREMTTERSPVVDWFWRYRNRIALASGGLLALAIAAWGMLLVVHRWPQGAVDLGLPSQVTFAEAWEGEPAMSPDGTRVAFARFDGHDHDIFWVAVKGGEPVAITAGSAEDRHPCWLPDGSGLLFVSDRGGRPGIWKSDLAGSGAMLIVPNATDPAVSPDGTRLAYTRIDSTGFSRVQVTTLADSGPGRCVSGGVGSVWSHFGPAWSPDGRTICFSDYHNLWAVGVDGDHPRQVTAGGTWDTSPVWAPDGRNIYFSSLRSGSSALWRVSADGGEPVRLTPGSGPECRPSLDRDGRWLAYSTEMTATNVLLADRIGGEVVPLTSGWASSQQPALAADAAFMVYVARRQEPGFSLWRRDLAAGVPAGRDKRLSEQSGSSSHPCISPDGRWVAYYQIDPGYGTREIYTVPAQGGLPIRITVQGGTNFLPIWSPDGSQLGFCSDRDGLSGLYGLPMADGRAAAAPRRLSPPNLAIDDFCWSPAGDQVAVLVATAAGAEVWIISLQPGTAARRLAEGQNITRIRWVADLDEIWACGWWADGRLEIRRLNPADGSFEPLSPPLAFSPGNAYGWFDTDRSGRYLTLTEDRHEGDIWVFQARDDRVF